MLGDGESCLEETFQASGTSSSRVKTHWFPVYNCHCSVAESCPTLQPDGLQHARLPCPSPSPGVFPDSRPLSRWCRPTVSSSVAPFSSWPQSFQASGSLPVSWSSHQGAESLGRVLRAHGWPWLLVSLPSDLPRGPRERTERQEVWDAVCQRHVRSARCGSRGGGVDTRRDEWAGWFSRYFMDLVIHGR